MKQQTIGTRCGGGTHKVDAIATRGDDRILVSLRWQQTGGTAEQKVPFEVMCLADAATAGHAVRAFLVLGGDGWKLRDYFTSGKLSEHHFTRNGRLIKDLVGGERGIRTLGRPLDSVTYRDSIATYAIFAMVAAPHCTGCTGDLRPLRTVIRRAGRVSAHAEKRAHGRVRFG